MLLLLSNTIWCYYYVVIIKFTTVIGQGTNLGRGGQRASEEFERIHRELLWGVNRWNQGKNEKHSRQRKWHLWLRLLLIEVSMKERAHLCCIPTTCMNSQNPHDWGWICLLFIHIHVHTYVVYDTVLSNGLTFTYEIQNVLKFEFFHSTLHAQRSIHTNA